MDIELSGDEQFKHDRLTLKLAAANRTKDRAAIEHAKRMLANYQNELLAQGANKILWLFNPSEH